MDKGRLGGIVVCLVLAAATLAAYWQVTGHEFVNFDDPVYVTKNPQVQAGLSSESVRWAFGIDKRSCNWHPLTWLSHILDVQLYGMKPMGHHLTNLLLHIAASILLFLALNKMTRSMWPSAFVAGLFALHPAHVESVAWVSERKDVLSAVFWMLTLLLYARYAERPGLGRYLPVLTAYALGLMAKPMLVSLPFVLLLLDYWPLGRLADRKRSPWRLIVEKIPLFALAAVSCCVTVVAQRAGDAMPPSALMPLGVRAANAVVAYMSYIGKAFWPANLAAFYQHPGHSLPQSTVQNSILGLVLITAAALLIGRKRPWMLAGWLWFVVTLVPVIGLVQVGAQSMADRYTYLPFIGLFVMAAWGIADLLITKPQPLKAESAKRTRHKGRLTEVAATCLAKVSPAAGPVIAAGLVVLAVLAQRTYVQAGYWHDSITLFEHAGKTTGPTALSYLNMANEQLAMKDYASAIENYEKSLSMNPDFAKTWNGYGNALSALGRKDEAVEKLRQAVRLDPDFAETHANLGIALAGLGKVDEAMSEFRTAIRLKPDLVEPHINLGVALINRRLLDEAEAELREAIRLDPNREEPHYNLAGIYFYKNDYARTWQEVHACRARGGSFDPQWLAALSQKMPEPQR